MQCLQSARERRRQALARPDFMHDILKVLPEEQSRVLFVSDFDEENVWEELQMNLLCELCGVGKPVTQARVFLRRTQGGKWNRFPSNLDICKECDAKMRK